MIPFHFPCGLLCCQSLGQDIPNINKCVLFVSLFAEQCGQKADSVRWRTSDACQFCQRRHYVLKSADVVTLRTGFILPGHVIMAGTRIPPSCKKHLPHPYAELKGPPLLNQGESLPPLNVGPLSEVNTIKVFSYRCSAFSFRSVGRSARRNN